MSFERIGQANPRKRSILCFVSKGRRWERNKVKTLNNVFPYNTFEANNSNCLHRSGLVIGGVPASEALDVIR